MTVRTELIGYLKLLILSLALVSVAAGCGGIGRDLRPEVAGGALSWPPSEGPAKSSSDDTVLVQGTETSSRGLDTSEVGTDLQLGPSAGLAWGIYSVSGFSTDVILDSIDLDYTVTPGSPDNGTELWIALANYTRGNWQWFNVDPSPTTVQPSPGMNYVSPNGRVHVACLLVGNGSVTVESLRFRRSGPGTFAPIIQSVVRRSGFEGETFAISAFVDNDVDSTYAWTFAGASPETSSEKSPQITLSGPSTSAASLVVTTASGTDTYDFTLFSVDSSDTVWDSAGFNSQHSCQIPLSGPSSNNLAWKYFAGYNPAVPTEVLTPVTFAADGTMYFGTKQGLISLNPDGTFRWRFNTSNWVVTAPAIAADGAVFFGVSTDGHYALESDGSLRWHNSGNFASSSGNPLLYNGGVYFVGGDKLLHGLNQLTGLPVISAYQYTDTFNKLSPHSAMTSDGIWLFGDDNAAYAYDVVNDLPKWAFPLGAGGLAGGPVLSSDESLAYITTDGGWVYAYRLSDGGQEFAVNANVDGPFGWSSPCMTADGTLNVLSEDFKLHQLDSLTGATLNVLTFPTGDESYRNPAVDYAGNYYVSSNNETELYACDKVGILLWQAVLGARQRTSPTIAPSGNLLVGCDDGYVYCFGPGSGAVLQPPFIQAVPEVEDFEGEQVTVSATLAGGAPDSYSWNFGGGASPNTSSAVAPTVTLGTTGYYDASLTVTNVYGTHTFFFAVHVETAGPPSDRYDLKVSGMNYAPITPIRLINGNPAVCFQCDTGTVYARSSILLPDSVDDWELTSVDTDTEDPTPVDLIEFGGRIYIAETQSNNLWIDVSSDLDPQVPADWNRHQAYSATGKSSGIGARFVVTDGKLTVMHRAYSSSQDTYHLTSTYANVAAPTQLSDWSSFEVSSHDEIPNHDVELLSDGTPAVVRFNRTGAGQNVSFYTSELERPQGPSDWASHVMAIDQENDLYFGFDAQLEMLGTRPAASFIAEQPSGEHFLYYAYSTSAKPTATSDWSLQQVLPDEVENAAGGFGTIGGKPGLLFAEQGTWSLQMALGNAADPTSWSISELDSDTYTCYYPQLLDLGTNTLVLYVELNTFALRVALVTAP